jgi:hypothetical protein
VEAVGGPTPEKALARYREWLRKYAAIVADREPHTVKRGVLGIQALWSFESAKTPGPQPQDCVRNCGQPVRIARCCATERDLRVVKSPTMLAADRERGVTVRAGLFASALNFGSGQTEQMFLVDRCFL